jgi:hypothetical protein
VPPAGARFLAQEMGEGLGPSEDVFGSPRGRITSQGSSNQQGFGPTIGAGAFRPGPMWSRVLRPEKPPFGLKMTRNLVGCAAGLIFWRYNQSDNGFASREAVLAKVFQPGELPHQDQFRVRSRAASPLQGENVPSLTIDELTLALDLCADRVNIRQCSGPVYWIADNGTHREQRVESETSAGLMRPIGTNRMTTSLRLASAVRGFLHRPVQHPPAARGRPRRIRRCVHVHTFAQERNRGSSI